MPELPEVETVKRGLAPAMEGVEIERLTLNRGDLRFPLPNDFTQVMQGATITHLGRRGKYLVLKTNRDRFAIIHLGMSGSFRVEGAQTRSSKPHDHVIFTMSGGAVITYNDPRRFGFMQLCDDLDAYPPFQVMGPEPWDMTAEALTKALRGKNTPIKTALLDQSVVAGLGNIYVCEALMMAGISPRRMAGTIKGVRAQRLCDSIHIVLDKAIKAGGSSLNDHRQTDGQMGYFQHHFLAYDREGEICPICPPETGATISKITQSGRSTFFCPSHQR